MKDLYIYFVLFVVFIFSLIVGINITNFNRKKKYNFLINFPFEMESSSFKLNIIFRFVLALFCGMCCICSIYFLFINGNYLLEKFLSLILVFNSFLLVSLFVINMKNYKAHLANSIVFMALNAVSYFLLGYIPLRDNFNYYPIWMMISGFILFALMMFLLLLPSIKNWYIMKKDEDGSLTRGKIFPLALLEWINILLYLLIFVLLLINQIINLI